MCDDETTRGCLPLGRREEVFITVRMTNDVVLCCDGADGKYVQVVECVFRAPAYLLGVHKRRRRRKRRASDLDRCAEKRGTIELNIK